MRWRTFSMDFDDGTQWDSIGLKLDRINDVIFWRAEMALAVCVEKAFRLGSVENQTSVRRVFGPAWKRFLECLPARHIER